MGQHAKHRALVTGMGARMALPLRALAVILMLAGGPATAACRLALALGLDVSGSVDDTEYGLQLSGVAEALSAPEVMARLMAVPEAPVAIAVFEWSSGSFQRVLVDWTLLTGPPDVAAVADRLRRITRVPAPESTGIGAAMRFGAEMIGRGPVCWQGKLDLSGDGKNNDWPVPRRIKGSGVLGAVTVNGLVIGQEADREGVALAELSAYFRAEIVHGPDAFVETAQGYGDYAAAMTRKLVRELDVPVLGALRP